MIKKLFRQMLVTQIVSAMTVTLCMLIDSIMIGRFLGVDAMSAYGLANPLLLLFAAIGSLIATGVQILCGKTVGAGDREATDACFTVSVLLAAGISVIGVVLVFVFLGPLTSLLGAGTPSSDNPVYGLTKDYITGFIIGAPAFLCAQIMVPYMQISGSRTRLIAAVAAMTVTDIVLDLLNVFVFRGGTFGMGLASTLSYYVAFGIGAGYFFRKDCMFRLRPGLFRISLCRKLAASGGPILVNQICTVLLVFLLNRLLLAVEGTHAVAAYSVISTVGNLCYCFGSGVGAVAMMLAAIFYTERDRSSIRELVRVMSRNGILLGIAVMLTILLAAKPLIALFLGSSSEAGTLAVAGLRLLAISLVPSSINSAYKNYYQGINRIRMTELICVLQNFVLIALFAYLLSRFLGVTGIWLGFVCGESATVLVFSALVWRHNRSFSLSADAYSMLDPDFGAAPERCFECTIQSVRDAVDASRQIRSFSRERGLDQRTAMLIALCVEEVTVNIIEHGFTKDKLPRNIDVRLVLEEDRRVIRVRDNCIRFDPTSYLAMHQSDDPAAHIGLRMVMGMTKEASYINSLGLNNLTLVL